MKLLEKYMTKPGNYIIESGGGYGKTTSLRCLAAKITGKYLNGKKQLAIYIPMAELNYIDGRPQILFEYLKNFFSSPITAKSIIEMIQKDKTTDYLFILDGMNEVLDYQTANGLTMLDYIYNDILRLIAYDNVHVMLSTRRAEIIPGDIRGKFELLRFQQISNERIRKYLHLKDTEILPGHLLKLLVNPMFLKIFKKLYSKKPELTLQINNKYELLELYFRYEMDLHKENGDRTYLFNYVIPYVAFSVEAGLLENFRYKEENLEEAIKEVLKRFPPDEEKNPGTICEEIFRTGLVNEKLQFSHEILRDYFACRGFGLAGEAGERDQVEAFMIHLNKWLEYSKTKKEKNLNRRTKFLDLADFIYAKEKACLDRMLFRAGVKPLEKRLATGQEFYQELSGVYDDISEGEKAAAIGWIGCDYLEKLEKMSENQLSIYEIAEKMNFLYYSIKWDISPEDEQKNKKILDYILLAKKKIEEIPVEEREAKEHDLYGRIMSNVGAYYYKLQNFAEAISWHTKSMEYKQAYCSQEALIRSYQTLMQDAYWIGEPVKAYGYYKAGFQELYPDRTLEDCLLFEDYKFPADFVERALGSEQLILSQDEADEWKEEILVQLPAQIAYVFEAATGHSRNHSKLIQSLSKKLDAFSECEWIRKDVAVQQVIQDYQKKCKSIL